jgi:DNA-binding response OmpR family regulator
MPMGELEDEQRGKILIVSQDQALIGHLKQKIEDTRVLKEEIVHSGFDAGIQAIDFHPDCVVVDLSIGQTEALQIFQNIRRNDVLREAFTIALIPDVGGQRRFDRTDIDETFKKPFDPILLVERMLTVIGKRKKLVLS